MKTYVTALSLTLAAALLLPQGAGFAQAGETVYSVPFASRGNSLQLAVANPSAKAGALEGIVVAIGDVPEWMAFTSRKFRLGRLEPGTEAVAGFTFHVDEQAPVGRPVTLTVTARSGGQLSWQKQIRLQVAAPSAFELEPNYPNPFNPTTTIAYRLPAQMKVTVTVFDVLGRKVAVLADGLQEAGRQILSWDATRFASGLYFYRVSAEGGGQHIVRHRKMLLVK